MSIESYYGTGKRKSSVAKVWMCQGDGKVTTNGKKIDEFFSSDSAVTHALFPLNLTELKAKYDLKINVFGGGFIGQAGAIRHAISVAILKSDPNLRLVLKRAGLLTRDSRVKERKKYGQAAARAKFQFSKR